MILNIETDDFTLSEDLKGTVESHMRLVLSRYDGVIENVLVSLKDLESEAEDGLSRACMVTINLSNSRAIYVQETAPDIYDAIQYCAQKMNRVLSRQVTTRNRFKGNSSSQKYPPAQTA